MVSRWARPPSEASLSRSASELRITTLCVLMRNSLTLRESASGGSARYGSETGLWFGPARENQSLQRKSLLRFA